MWNVDEGRERERIEALRGYRILDTPPDPRLDRITDLVSRIFAVPIAMITLIDERRQWFKSRVGLDIPETARAIAFCHYTVAARDVLVVEDAFLDPRFRDNPLVVGPLALRFYAGAPLVSPLGHVIGTLAVASREPRKVAAWELAMLRALAALVMDELELWRRISEADAAQAEAFTLLRAQHAREQAKVERRFQVLVENAPDLLTLLDREGRIVYASPSLERLLGFTSAEVIGASAFDIWSAEEERQENVAVLAKMVRTPGAVVRSERKLRHKDGSARLVSIVAQNLLGEPAVEAVVINGRDITADAQTRAELARSLEHLRQAQKMEALGRLAGGIAHDFNNLLTVILNNALFAIEASPAGSPLREELDQIREAGERAATLTRQILAFGRRQPLAPAPNDLNALVGNLLPLLPRLLGEQVELVFQPAAGAPGARVDRAQAEQVLMNLCANARDAMPGGGRITIRTAAVTFEPADLAGRPWARAGQFVLLAVRDNGTGMVPEVLTRAFEPFFTTKSPGQGTGLGLATVYGVVAQHDGLLDVESAPGQGTEVRVYFPAAGPAASAPGKSAARAPRGVGELLLLAEDDPLVRSVAVRLLSDAGYRVQAASDGREAVTLFSTRPAEFSLVVLDAVMPQLGGVGALEEMRKIRPEVRYLICTGYTAEETSQEDDAHWLAKPYGAQTLLARVRALIDAPVVSAAG